MASGAKSRGGELEEALGLLVDGAARGIAVDSSTTENMAGMSGTTAITCVRPLAGQRISRRLMRVARPNPISMRWGEPPKLETEPCARWIARSPVPASSMTSFTRAP